MSEKYKGYLRARLLRSTSTKSEQVLWAILRAKRFKGYKFRRQHPVGPYVLDFYCARKRMGIELDGEIHNNPAAQQYDQKRTRTLASAGRKIIRFSNYQVLKQKVLVENIILKTLQNDSPSPHGGEGAGGRGHRLQF
ncbi:MAG: endonuclease domain-containing protein [Deltaproteobacteria bacterium]|nr:endonuclease domain-containing protein [Deltaproteobacteria bacterium]